MSLFIYTALDSNGRRKTGEIQTPDKAGALARLSREKLTPLTLEEKKTGTAGLGLGSTFSFRKNISPVEKIMLTRHLATVVKAGLSFREALEILSEDSKNPFLKQVLFDARTVIERGQQLSTAFEMYPKHFSPVFVGLIRAGEKSGTLESALSTLGAQISRDYELMKKVRAALVYPAILLAASVGVVVLLLTFLLPRLIRVFESSVADLPWITRVLVDVSHALSARPLVTVFAFLALLISFFFIVKSARGRTLAVGALGKFPLAGDIVHKLALARFSRTLHHLFKSGIGAMEGLEIAAESVGNSVYKDAILEVREEVRKGGTLASAFAEREKLFPRLFISMMRVGEQTGTLESSLATVADFYDEEVDRLLKTLVSLLEPALLLIMGIVVGGIALSVLLPIYQLMTNLR
jgi:type II secretory pathway component PulF